MPKLQPDENFAAQVGVNLGIELDELDGTSKDSLPLTDADELGVTEESGADDALPVYDTQDEDLELGEQVQEQLQALPGQETQEPDAQQEQVVDPLAGLFTQDDQAPTTRPEKYGVDAKGNIISASGEVLARAGTERRLYQSMHKAQDQAVLSRQENVSLRDKIVQAVNLGRELHTKLKFVQEQGNAGAALGLAPQEVTNALQLASDLKTNPQEGLKKLLTQLTINGIDISGLGLESSVDTKALGGLIRTELESATRPIREQQARQEQAAQIRNQQAEQYRQVEQSTRMFFQTNPDAAPHLQTIMRMYNDPQYSGRTLQENWLQLQLYLERNPGSSDSTFPRQQRSLPNGRPNAAPQQQRASAQQVAPVDQDYSSIINDILAEYKVA